MTYDGTTLSIQEHAAWSPASPGLRIWLIRHGETEWSITGQHSGRYDLPLTSAGEREAEQIGCLLNGRKFELVLCSPLQRAARTCQLAGYDSVALMEPDVQEWDYGACTGMTERQLREKHAGWNLWDGPIPEGESIDDIAIRARRSVARIRDLQGNVAIFSHGHFLRVFVTQWLGVPPQVGKHFALDTGAICILGSDAGVPAIRKWNVNLLAH